MKKYTQSELKKLQKELLEYETIFNKGIEAAVDHVSTIHMSTLLNIPTDLDQRMKDASDRGDLIIREDGAIQFTPLVKTNKKEK